MVHAPQGKSFLPTPERFCTETSDILSWRVNEVNPVGCWTTVSYSDRSFQYDLDPCENKLTTTATSLFRKGHCDYHSAS
ncbi:hypothetical protein K523DRAFT_146430 [Schizophyllum commune Tattone D]|nr:hypothetical protein K523DRAFT_146430 [Schizophyllum commune Tattone D]